MLYEIKKIVIPAIVLGLIFTAAMLYRSHYVDPIADEAYAEIYGLEEEGAEW